MPSVSSLSKIIEESASSAKVSMSFNVVSHSPILDRMSCGHKRSDMDESHNVKYLCIYNGGILNFLPLLLIKNGVHVAQNT